MGIPKDLMTMTYQDTTLFQVEKLGTLDHVNRMIAALSLSLCR